jgi:hypothetical protein
MTNEEMQRAMDFIVETETKSSAKIDALAEAQKEGQKNADERWARTEVRIRALLTVALIHERQYFDRIYREHKRNYRRNGR